MVHVVNILHISMGSTVSMFSNVYLLCILSVIDIVNNIGC